MYKKDVHIKWRTFTAAGEHAHEKISAVRYTHLALKITNLVV